MNWPSDKVFEAVGRLCASYAILENVVVGRIWTHLGLTKATGPTVTDRLDIKTLWPMLQAAAKAAGSRDEAQLYKQLNKVAEDLADRRNLVVHGRIVFSSDAGSIVWWTARGPFARKPVTVDAAFAEAILIDCDALWMKLVTIGTEMDAAKRLASGGPAAVFTDGPRF